MEEEILADPDPNSIHSTLRERIVEHVFVGDVLRRLWQRHITDVEVLRSEFDAGGYDLVFSYMKIVRHIQLKTTGVHSKTRRVNISLKLSEKPSGCVIWIVVDPDRLDLISFLWFGGPPGAPLPNIREFKIAKHTKGDSDGIKNARPNQRTIPRHQFESLISLDAVLERLFGSEILGYK